MKSPAFQFYPADFLSDANVAVMSAAEVGAYLLLTLYAWRENGLPDDIEELAVLGRMPLDEFKASWERRISRCFDRREDGRLAHPRLERERAKQQEFRDKMSEAGKRGGRPPNPPGKALAKGRLSGEKGSASEKKALLSSSSSSNTPAVYGADFEMVWRLYPKRTGANKKQTERLISGHLKAGVDFDVIHSGTLRYVAYVTKKAWLGTEFVKMPQVFFGRDQHFLSEWECSDIPANKALMTKEERAAKQYKQRGYVT